MPGWYGSAGWSAVPWPKGFRFDLGRGTYPGCGTGPSAYSGQPVNVSLSLSKSHEQMSSGKDEKKLQNDKSFPF